MGSDCIDSWSWLIFLLCISKLLWLCRVVVLKSLPVHSFNAVIIAILRGCLQSPFNILVPWCFFDTASLVFSWPAFVSRCITDACFSFYGLVLDIDMNCGCKLYRFFCQTDLTYAIPNFINNFRTLIPAVRLRPLNLLSASSVNLHGLANTSIFHNNLRVMLSPLKSPALCKYSNPFKDLECILVFRSAMPRGVTIVCIYVPIYRHFICEW